MFLAYTCLLLCLYYGYMGYIRMSLFSMQENYTANSTSLNAARESWPCSSVDNVMQCFPSIWMNYALIWTYVQCWVGITITWRVTSVNVCLLLYVMKSILAAIKITHYKLRMCSQTDKTAYNHSLESVLVLSNGLAIVILL